MLTGMLWTVDSVPTLADIQRGIDFYEKKYGIKPDLCYYSQNEVNFPKLPKTLTRELECVASDKINVGSIWFGKKKGN